MSMSLISVVGDSNSNNIECYTNFTDIFQSIKVILFGCVVIALVAFAFISTSTHGLLASRANILDNRLINASTPQ